MGFKWNWNEFNRIFNYWVGRQRIYLIKFHWFVYRPSVFERESYFVRVMSPFIRAIHHLNICKCLLVWKIPCLFRADREALVDNIHWISRRYWNMEFLVIVRSSNFLNVQLSSQERPKKYCDDWNGWLKIETNIFPFWTQVLFNVHDQFY